MGAGSRAFLRARRSPTALPEVSEPAWASSTALGPSGSAGTGLPRLRHRPAWPLSAFAADDTSVQLCWPASPAGELRIEVGDAVVELEASPKASLLVSLYGS